MLQKSNESGVSTGSLLILLQQVLIAALQAAFLSSSIVTQPFGLGLEIGHIWLPKRPISIGFRNRKRTVSHFVAILELI